VRFVVANRLFVVNGGSAAALKKSAVGLALLVARPFAFSAAIEDSADVRSLFSAALLRFSAVQTRFVVDVVQRMEVQLQLPF
jgi:hypothetical protein